jgi:hypothetical protein
MNVDERLERLETIIRRQREAFYFLILTLIGIFSIGPTPATQPDAPAKTLTVSKLSVQDSNGRERIVLAEGTVLLKDEKGTDRVSLFTNQNNVAQLKFFDSKGIPRIATSIEAKDVAVNALYDPSGAGRIATGVDDQGGAFFRFNDTKGRRRYDVGTDGEDQVLEVFYDRKDNALINAGVLKDKAFFKLFDANGKALVEQP